MSRRRIVSLVAGRVERGHIRRAWHRRLAPHTSRPMRTLFVAVFALACFTDVAAAQSGGVKAFTGLTLIDGTDRAPVANATIVVRDGRIVAAGAASRVTVPAGAERVALGGKTVIPGLINAHGHVNAPADLATYAAYGVTTVFSLG